jgi:hypothetical protein
MLLRLEYLPGIENARSYPAETVSELEHLLRTGAPAFPDPGRKGFFDLKNAERTFFIHISPISGHVALLAVWFHPATGVDRTERAEAELSCTA